MSCDMTYVCDGCKQRFAWEDAHHIRRIEIKRLGCGSGPTFNRDYCDKCFDENVSAK